MQNNDEFGQKYVSHYDVIKYHQNEVWKLFSLQIAIILKYFYVNEYITI